MNRKLLNGLLVLAVATSGAVSFTSCKDEDFSNEIRVGQIGLQAQIDAIRNVTDPAFRTNLQQWLDLQCKAENFDYFKDFKDLVEKTAELYTVYNAIVTGNYDDEYAQKYVDGLYNWMFENTFPSEEWFNQIYLNQAGLNYLSEQMKAYQSNLAQMVTNINLNQTYNPVFGTINLPIGISSKVLATYLYEASGDLANFNFPKEIVSDANRLASIVNTPENQEILKTIQSLAAGVELENYSFTNLGGDYNGNMGNAIITINPTNVNFAGAQNIQIVDSKGNVILDGALPEVEEDEEDAPATDGEAEETEEVIPELELVPYNDVLDFGMTRDGMQGGVYALKANATKENWSNMAVRLSTKSDLADAVKNLIKERNLSDLATLGNLIYKSISDLNMPAYAVKVWWEEAGLYGVVEVKEEDGTLVDKKYAYKLDADGNPQYEVTYYTYKDGKKVPAGTDEEGNVIVTPYMEYTPVLDMSQEYEPVINSVLSPFDLAAAVVHPLSYNTMSGYDDGSLTSFRMPRFSPIRDYIEDIRGRFNYSLDYRINHIDMKDAKFEIGSGTIRIDVSGLPVYSKENPDEIIGYLGDEAYIDLTYGPDGIKPADEGTLQYFVEQLGDEVDDYVGDIVSQVNEMINSINNQLDSYNTKVNNKFNELLDRLESDRKLRYAQKLLDLYNKIAARVNFFLDQPSHYLQVMMACGNDNEINTFHMSTDVLDPTRLEIDGGNATYLYTTSYTGDVLVPSYKKYVAITGVYDMNGNPVSGQDLKGLNSKAGLNTVFNGIEQKITFDVSALDTDKVYQITYVSVDYSAVCSMNSYYVRKVVK